MFIHFLSFFAGLRVSRRLQHKCDQNLQEAQALQAEAALRPHHGAHRARCGSEWAAGAPRAGQQQHHRGSCAQQSQLGDRRPRRTERRQRQQLQPAHQRQLSAVAVAGRRLLVALAVAQDVRSRALSTAGAAKGKEAAERRSSSSTGTTV